MTVLPTDIEESDDPVQSIEALARKLRNGGEAAQAEFFELHRKDLRQFALSLIDPRIRKRLDESDVVQEGFIKFKREIAAYLADPRIPPRIWLRRVIRQTVWNINRDHLGTQARDPRRELRQGDASDVFVDEIAGSISSVGHAANRKELQINVRDLVTLMPIQQREILWLVHVEACTLREAADELEISYEAAKKRYQRALLGILDRYGTKLKQLNDPDRD